MYFYAVWNTEKGNQAHGYVRAGNRDHARHILQTKLTPGYTVTEIAKAYKDMITSQSITLNFQNTLN